MQVIITTFETMKRVSVMLPAGWKIDVENLHPDIASVKTQYEKDKDKITAIRNLRALQELSQDKIVAHIEARGDRSVGMFPFMLKLTIDGLDMKRDVEEPADTPYNGRKYLRKALGEFFYNLLDYGGVNVWFSDECPDCGALLEKRKKHACPFA
jgi:DNA-directed RNA polymerase subunit K/omega